VIELLRIGKQLALLGYNMSGYNMLGIKKNIIFGNYEG